MSKHRRFYFAALTLLLAAGLALLAGAQTKKELPKFTVKSPHPLWADYGVIINDSAGNTPQQNPQLVTLSDGNLGLVWEDGRNGYTNIFAQKLDRSGTRLWADVKLQAGGKPNIYGNQNNPAVIDDGAGGVIVAWQGYCNGSADIFAQHVSAAGAVLWGQAGIAVCNAPAGQFAPRLASDGAGGAIIAWHDYRSGAGEDVYAQRIDKNGQAIWASNGVPVCTLPGTQWYPRIASDEAGGAVIVWTDGRVSSSDNNIYGQRLNAAGKPLWDKDGLAVCSAPQNQEKPVILASDKGSVIVAWQDSRAGNLDIYAQKLGGNGKPLWNKDGVAAVIAPYAQEDPQLADDGGGGAVVVWADDREENPAIYAQKISADGTVQWEDTGRQLAKAPGRQESPCVVKLQSPNWLVVWQDSRKGFPLIYGQKISHTGINMWPEAGLPLAPGNKAQERPALALAGEDQAVAVWQDRRNGEYDIYGQKISGDGIQGWEEEGKVLANATGSVLHQNVGLIDNGQGEALVVFEDARSGYLNIYLQKLGKDGTLLWGRNAVPVAKIKADQANPQIVPDGTGGAIIAWEDHRNPRFTKIFAQRVSGAGEKVWKSGSRPLTRFDSRQTSPVIVSDGAGGAIAVWQDERNVLSLKDLYGQRISAKGDLLWGNDGLPICGENGDQLEQALTSDGAGGVILAWTDFRRGDRNPDIYAQRLDGSGSLLWANEGLLVCGAPDVQKAPAISGDGQSGFIVAWTDKGGGSYDVYAQRINSQGKALWLTDGIPISQVPRTQQNPLLGNQVIVWEDYRYGNWDIYANSISFDGKLLWGEEGVPIVSVPLTQYSPKMIGWGGNTIIAWEDYREGRQYEIFMQMLDDLGRRVWTDNGFQVKSTDGARAPKLLALPEIDAFLVVWEDYTGGGKAISGQLFSKD
ncbi:MAG: hypothetical protein JW873_03105 [Candidatus Saganbacteria bacterium]|nr:hypothetical protein [Candidatus Saganbacteria bacterium]